MPPKKKAKVELTAAPAIAKGDAWQRLNDAGTHWEDYSAADAAAIAAAAAAKLPSLAAGDAECAPKGATTMFDLGKLVETVLDTGRERPMRCLAAPAWEYKDDSGLFVGFYDDDNARLEGLYRACAFAPGAPAVFQTKDLSFNVDFGSMYSFTIQPSAPGAAAAGKQKNEDSGRERELRRGSAAAATAVWATADFGIAAMKAPPAPILPAAGAGGGDSAAAIMAPPAHWQPQSKPMEYFTVDPATAEYADVLKPFVKTLNQKSHKIISVQRLQNTALWRFYALTRHRVAQRNGGNASERNLFHGCRVRKNMDAILEYGFDMRVACDGLAGVGIYFALNASYSNCGYVLQNGDKSKEMIVCRVACGRDAPGLHGMKRPPLLPKSTAESYDSTSRLPTMYVVYDNAQAYPEYIIKYKH
jgi:hypothetical protein